MFFLRKLQWRLVSIFTAFAIVLIIIVGVVLNLRVESTYYNTFISGIERGFDEWAKLKNWDVKDMTDVSIQEVSEQLRNDSKIYFYMVSENRGYTILTKNGSSIIDSTDKHFEKGQENEFLYREVLTSKNVMAVMAGKETGSSARLNYVDGSTTGAYAKESAYFDYARLLRLKEGDYILYFRYYKEEWEDSLNKLNRSIITSLFVAIAVSLFLGYVFSKTITRPITNIMIKARKIADGDFDQVLEVKSADEIGELTKTFNYMARELKKTMAQISSEKNKVETILNYMRDGVIAFNLKGEIIHVNPAAKKLLGMEEEWNFSFNEFTKKYNLGITLEEITYLESTETKIRNAEIDNKFFKVYFASFIDEAKKVQGIMCVLQDNTEQQKLETMRREFVANVSHELKTPLTSIATYSETLLDGALEDRETAEKFVGVINKEAERMTRLVKDLLLLSSLDESRQGINSGKFKLVKREISFVDLVKNCVDKMQIEARAKKQKLESFVIGKVPLIEADHDRMEQVILNILSNAIKYTPEGGQITVYIGVMYTEVYVKVVDTGIGIPKEDLPQVFDRFYRVDKARSREMGGTGLGLSIVREIVELHNGSVTITSEEKKGTEVTVKLPISDTKLCAM